MMLCMLRQVIIAGAFLLSYIQAQTPEWRVDLGMANANQLYVADDYIFAICSQSMLRLDSETGSIDRKISIKSTNSNPTTMIAYEKRSTTHYLLSSHANGDVFAYDTRLGDLMWSFHNITSNPVIDWEFGVAVYMITDDGRLLAVDSMSGFLVWSIQVDAYSADDKLHLSFDNERLYVSKKGGQVQIYSTMDGSHLSSPYFDGVEMSILVGDFLYFYKNDKIMVYYVNERVEAALWSSSEMGQLSKVVPMDDGIHVLLLTSTGIHKVNHWSGKIKWNFQPTMDIVSIATEGNAVYVVLELLEPTFLVKLDGRSGEKDWTFYVDGEMIIGEVKVHNDAVYVLTSDETQTSHLIKLQDSEANAKDEMFKLQVSGIVYN
jgi:outer membrane protein assembly factor BamB